MDELRNLHPDAPAGGGGPGAFRSALPWGANPELDGWRCPQPLGSDLLLILQLSDLDSLRPATGASTHNGSQTPKDPAIEALNLSKTAKRGAYLLKQKFPFVTFTSGRRSKYEQARAMAANVVRSHNRNWITKTYKPSAARKACQKWIDENEDKKTKEEIATGLKGVLDGFSDAQLRKLSLHLSGDAFDVLPIVREADEIKKAMNALPHRSGFLDKEGGLVRWHVQF